MADYRICADCGNEFLDETTDGSRVVCTVCEVAATDTDQYRAWREQAERLRRWKRNGKVIAMEAADAARREQTVEADAALLLMADEVSDGIDGQAAGLRQRVPR